MGSRNTHICGHIEHSYLHQKIRSAAEPNNPKIIDDFLSLRAFETMHSTIQRREYLSTQFQLLLETIADECLPPHWRCLCLNRIHYPILALQQMADCVHSKRQVRLLMHELRMTSHFLQAGLQH